MENPVGSLVAGPSLEESQVNPAGKVMRRNQEIWQQGYPAVQMLVEVVEEVWVVLLHHLGLAEDLWAEGLQTVPSLPVVAVVAPAPWH